MPKARYIRGNLRRGDYARCLITDTSPYEVPLIVSNDGFYRNVHDYESASPALKSIIDKLVTEDTGRYTVPFRFKIAKDSLSVRTLSLLHPRSQYRVAEFYRTYDSLICYYCSTGNFSIRRPEKVGSTFFFRSALSDSNKFKNDRVDTSELELFVRNPASFFTYSGVSRLYKFFSSSDFMRLEKKYPHMSLMDVSKCFPSIYTHSVSWAIKGAAHSKNNVSASSFGNDFDKLMQRMNYNETNGICIGPEVSRIFAEVILNAVDRHIQDRAAEAGLLHGRAFECRRYVDDYLVFAKNKSAADEIFRIIEECLGEYNLHLNELKLQQFERPFLTPKSHTINSAKNRLASFFDGVTEHVGEGILAPKRVYRPDALVRSLIATIKSGCYDEGVGYDMVANYVIASLVKRIERLCADFDEATQNHSVLPDLYKPLLLRLLEAVFFFYTVQPTVPSSFHVGRALIVFWRFVDTKLADEKMSVSGQIQRWIGQLVRQHSTHEEFAHRVKVPVEFLNVVLAAAETDERNIVDSAMLREFVFNSKREDYFSLVSCLFYIKDTPVYEQMRLDAEQCILRVLGDCSGAKDSAHDAHLVLDSICCPYISLTARRQLLGSLRKALGLPTRSKTELESDISEMEGKPWFVQWTSLDILSMIQKKELSSVY